MKRTGGWRKWAAAGAVALAGAVAASGGAAVHAAGTGATVTVGMGTVHQVIPLAGTVGTPSEASVQYQGPVTTVSAVDVSAGQAVTAEQVLATLANGVTLTAPFAGTVVNVALNPGDVVPNAGAETTSLSGARTLGQTLVTHVTPLSITVANVGQLVVQATVNQALVRFMAAGDPVRLILPGEPGIVYAGHVTAVAMAAPDASGGAAAYPVQISLTVPSGDRTPRLGMSVQAYVTAKQARGLTVPIAAVHADGAGYAVVLANGVRQPVKLGLVGVNHVVVTAGLARGDHVRVPTNGRASRSVTVGLASQDGVNSPVTVAAVAGNGA